MGGGTRLSLPFFREKKMELKELWRKQKLKGVFVQTVDSPAMPLIAQQAGMDFIFYDCEHGSFTYDILSRMKILRPNR